MSQPPADDLRWAAIQLLQQYERCGISRVLRGTDRLTEEWSKAAEAPLLIVEKPRNPNESTSSDLPRPKNGVAEVASAPDRPLPPMPLIPLRSGSQVGKSPSPTLPPGIGIGEKKWLGPPLPDAEREEVFTTLRDQIASCKKCEELACSRKQTVFGVGKLSPRVVFFGEAPGADEDRLGEPFVGAAGQLLNKIMNASQMKREDVYILNSLKCRPPGNRTPVDVEIENCRSFFEAQLDVLQPEFIVCLGAVAVRAVLQTTESVGRLRGRFHRYRNAQVLVTYHPAYLLRNESVKKHVWDDMKLLMGAMGLKLPNT